MDIYHKEVDIVYGRVKKIDLYKEVYYFKKDDFFYFDLDDFYQDYN